MRTIKPILTKQEQKVLEHLAEGKSSNEIANILYISSTTVTFHRKNLMNKLIARNSAHLIHKANKMDLFEKLSKMRVD